MREEWALAYTEVARAYWTQQRTEQLTGGKNLTVLPAEAPLLLRALGLLRGNGSMPPAQVRKYQQINHIVAQLGPCLRELRETCPVVHVLDAGCGRSYLTVLLAWVFVHIYEHPVKILGVDRSVPLVEECRRRTEMVGLEDVLRYEPASIGELDVDDAWSRAFGTQTDLPVPIHALVSLHACDTATDDAIALGLAREATLIAAVPCCQAELAAQWKALGADADVAHPFAPLWSMPHIRRTAASTLTDTFRALLLSGAGYKTTALEFIASEHTPKNTLIRAMRRHAPDASVLSQYVALRQATGDARIALEAQLPEPLRRIMDDLSATLSESLSEARLERGGQPDVPDLQEKIRPRSSG